MTKIKTGQFKGWVQIGNQIWMAENLNYRGVGSDSVGVCYLNHPDSCAKYGRLYIWAEVMNGASSSSSNPSGVQGICPVGWHVPSFAEWGRLIGFAGDWLIAGTKLRSQTGWNTCSVYIPGTDEYGFSALPGGRRDSNASTFRNAGIGGHWWSATESNASSGNANNIGIYCNERMGIYVSDKSNGFSLRCVKD
ncbi:MAG: hypothetical protein FWE57_01895 [Chitinispirillia bacterium]|nr:hypothetical protein [Chitinispirillia bacterium]